MDAKDLGLLPQEVTVLEGDYRKIMSQLVAANLPVWGPDQILCHKNNIVGNPRPQYIAWNNYFFTDYGIAKTGTAFILLPHSVLLRAVTPETRLVSNGLSLTEEDIKQTRQYSHLDMLLNQPLNEEEAHTHLGWLTLMNNDQKLLDTTVENTFRFGKDKYDYDQMMGFYVPQDKDPILRAVMLCSLVGNSNAMGNDYLNIVKDARLIGSSSVPTCFILNYGREIEQILQEYHCASPSRLRNALAELEDMKDKLRKERQS